MAPELRKRKTPAPPPPPRKKSATGKGRKSTADAQNGKPVKAESKPREMKETKETVSLPSIAVGQTITLDGFGGEIQTHDGEKTSLKQLVEKSGNGVVLFTYPKASTPGCTTQACLFRDSYTPLTATGFSIYGLSTDSPQANTTFKTKQQLPYALLCDPAATLIGAINFKKAPKGTTRGVFVVDKQGKILVAEPGGPEATVNAVRKLVGEDGAPKQVTEADGQAAEKAEKAEDKAKAEVAADVADTAATLEGESKL